MPDEVEGKEFESERNFMKDMGDIEVGEEFGSELESLVLPVTGGAMVDLLNREERIRLEALNQAVQLNMGVAISDEQVLHVATRFERFIRGIK